jgi:hypothetical protein
MAYTTVNKSSDFFNTKLYTGNGGSSTDSITGINFQPDWVWIKARNNTYNHNLYDSVRGLSSGAILSNSTAAQDSTQRISSFDSDGFTLPATNYTYVNASGTNYVAWNWKAGTTSGLSGGTITPSAYSINTTSKFGIYKYTGNGSGSQTIAHGLGATPTCVMFKQTNGTEQWRVHFMKAPNPYIKMLLLNSSAAESSQTNGLSAVSSTTITFGSDGAYNLNGNTYICYVFCDAPGFSKMGIYTGNGNADGPMIYTGFKPAFIMIKRTDTIADWLMKDNKRPTVQNPVTSLLYPNTSGVEATGVNDADFLSNGYKIRTIGTYENASGGTFVYMAFAEAPLVGSNNVPCTAR